MSCPEEDHMGQVDQKACARRLVALLDAGDVDRARFAQIADMLYLDAEITRSYVLFEHQGDPTPCNGFVVRRNHL